MLKVGFLLLQATCGQQIIPVPMPVPVPVVVTMPVPVPVPVPVPMPMPGGGGGGRAALPSGYGWNPLDAPDHIQPEEAAGCDAHPDCQKHDGLCCPSADGNRLACCDSHLSHFQADNKYIVTLTEGATVRKEPSMDSEAVTEYEYGKTFDVEDHKADDKGVQFLKTSEGWLLAKCPASGEHVADHVIPPEPEVHIATAPQGLIVRAGLEKDSERVGVVRRGEAFHVLERVMSEKGELRLRIGTNRWITETCSKTGERIAEPAVPTDGEEYFITSDEDVDIFEGKDLVDKVGSLKKGDEFVVIERLVDDQNRHILRTSKGYLSETNAAGVDIADRTKPSVQPDPAAAAADPAAAEGDAPKKDEL